MPEKSSSPSSSRPERVFLIDSMSHIFRAFYAPMQNRAAPLATAQGQVTQAVYIFTNMLIKLLREEKPDYIAAIFESKEKTFRHGVKELTVEFSVTLVCAGPIGHLSVGKKSSPH